MRVNGLTKGFFILIVFIVTLAFFDVLSPYYSAILWAAILAVIFNPVKNKIRTRLGERNGLAALMTVVIICLIVFTPLAIIPSSLAYELNLVYSKLQHNDTQFPTVVASLFAHLPGWARSFLAEHNLDSAQQIQQHLSDAALKGGQYLAGSAFMIGKGTFGFTVSFGIMLYLLFFLLKDGPYLVLLILESLPLSSYVKQHLFAKFAAVARATVKGTVAVALAQGALGSFAFWVAGLDGSILWGALMAFLSLIPAVGSAIIWVPAAIYLFATGAAVAGGLYRWLLCDCDWPGGQHSASAAGGQGYQDAGLPDPDRHSRRHGNLRYQRFCDRPADRRLVYRLLEPAVGTGTRRQHG